MVKHLLMATEVVGVDAPAAMGCPHGTWMDAAMEDLRWLAARAWQLEHLPDHWPEAAQHRTSWRQLKGWVRALATEEDALQVAEQQLRRTQRQQATAA